MPRTTGLSSFSFFDSLVLFISFWYKNLERLNFLSQKSRMDKKRCLTETQDKAEMQRMQENRKRVQLLLGAD
jgi:hypothetical protein